MKLGTKDAYVGMILDMHCLSIGMDSEHEKLPDEPEYAHSCTRLHAYKQTCCLYPIPRHPPPPLPLFITCDHMRAGTPGRTMTGRTQAPSTRAQRAWST